MKKVIGIVMVLLLTISLVGCSNIAAKEFGGDMTLNLPKGQKIVNVTWKDSDFWYLTKPMKDDDIEETYTFQEDSTFGVAEGTVTIIEHK